MWILLLLSHWMSPVSFAQPSHQILHCVNDPVLTPAVNAKVTLYSGVAPDTLAPALFADIDGPGTHFKQRRVVEHPPFYQKAIYDYVAYVQFGFNPNDQFSFSIDYKKVATDGSFSGSLIVHTALTTNIILKCWKF